MHVTELHLPKSGRNAAIMRDDEWRPSVGSRGERPARSGMYCLVSCAVRLSDARERRRCPAYFQACLSPYDNVTCSSSSGYGFEFFNSRQLHLAASSSGVNLDSSASSSLEWSAER
jgi:hypothetical protein